VRSTTEGARYTRVELVCRLEISQTPDPEMTRSRRETLDSRAVAVGVSPAARVPRFLAGLKLSLRKCKEERGRPRRPPPPQLSRNGLHRLETAAPTSTLSVVTRDLNRAVVHFAVVVVAEDKLFLPPSPHGMPRLGKTERENCQRHRNKERNPDAIRGIPKQSTRQ